MTPNKKMTIISGFPGVGKTTCSNSNLDVADLVSANYSFLNAEDRNPAFPKNYVDAICGLGNDEIVLISAHDEVRDLLAAENIQYILVYPRRDLKAEYMRIYKERGNTEAFIKLMDNKWDDFIDSCEADTNAVFKVQLNSGNYLYSFAGLLKRR